MRQTSRAVALLLALESANAAPTAQLPATIAAGGDYITVFNPSGAGSSVIGQPSVSQQLNNRNAGYTNTPRTFGIDGNTPIWTAVTYRFAIMADNVLATAATTVSGKTGSGCMNCINGGGVWCSRTFSYLSSSATNLFQYNGLTAASLMSAIPADVDTGDALDAGSCCDSVTNLNVFIGTKAQAYGTALTRTNVDNTASKAVGGVQMVPAACAALMSTTAVVASGANSNFWGESEIDNTTTIRSSWWCSNGLYKKVTVVGTVKLNANQTIAAGANKRQELAQVGCPNPKIACATGASVALLLVAGTPRVITMPVTIAGSGGFTTGMKCTWVAYATLAAPQWTMNESATSSGVGLTGSNWQIHAMEYTGSTTTTFDASNGSLVPGAGAGLILEAEGLSAGSMTPLFTMPAAQFATLRTWYGEGTAAIDTMTGQSSNWLSPGMAAMTNTANQSLKLLAVRSQLYGNVANVPVSNNVASITDVAIGDFNYGTFNSVVFDLRQMRYFPAKVAQTQHAAGTTDAATYATALSSYNTAKTTWDAYVAILEKNAKQDAFAALFSPPKAPTVPPLPNKPWTPNAYSGYTRASNLDVAAAKASITATSAASPTASQVWSNLAAAQTLGGWGSFTAATYTYRNGWGKSFGTIGYDGNTASIADVWNPSWQCIASTTTGMVSTTSQCSPTYTVTAGTKTATDVTVAANSVKMITAVSLWSTASSATSATKYAWGTTLNGFGITFQAGGWASGIVPLTSIAAPTAAVAAKSLTGIAGAQALVASSAAALAVAAALY